MGPEIEIADGRNARLNIESDEGMRIALDGLVRYLAQRPGETVRAIARLVKLLPGGGGARLASFSRGFHDVIAGMPEAQADTVPPTRKDPSRIIIARARIHDVDIEGLYSVPAEMSEAAP